MGDLVQKPQLTVEELLKCTELMEAIARDQTLLSPFSTEQRIRLLIAAGRVVRPARHEITPRIKAHRKAERAKRRHQDHLVRASTQIRMARLDSVFIPPLRISDASQPGEETGARLQKPRACYICKDEFSRLHFFYDALCGPCAALNYEKRFQSASLTGQVALITGARLKIGYQAALMMLRAGARVIVTTRFPRDAAIRYAREPDFEAWRTRLSIHALDLRHTPSVEYFSKYIETNEGRLDILINNAAQTVRRPPGFYSHLMETEQVPLAELPRAIRDLVTERKRESVNAPIGITASALLSQISYSHDFHAEGPNLFPPGKLDADLQQVDHRSVNSWRLGLADVPTSELLEVQLVNSIAPFVLCSKLIPLMMRDRTDRKHIVNVSAVEGQFSRHTKTDKHPHTNMAKAALNMLTLTSARDYAKSCIFMNAVDTGWVTDEDPAILSARKQADHDFQPPLDIVDGAARICDPFFSGMITGKHTWGCFLKDYFAAEW